MYRVVKWHFGLSRQETGGVTMMCSLFTMKVCHSEIP